MSFLKKDLLYTHYSWVAMEGDNPKITGQPDSTLFNRNEGYEVLYLINKMMQTYDVPHIASGQKIEKMIRIGLPSDVRSQINVISWIVQNWGKY